MKHLFRKKSFFVLILIALFFSSCQEKQFENPQKAQSNTDVSDDLAKTVALNFSNKLDFLHQSAVSLSTLKSSEKSNRKIKSVKIIYDENNLPAIYIMNLDPNGFVIVSGTKKESPILAFSENTNFSLEKTNNNGLKNWIRIFNGKISSLRKNETAKPNDSITEQWASMAPPIDQEETIPGPTVNEQVGPLLQTKWSQGDRYNDLVPYLGCSGLPIDGRAWTGCVAVAMAQVMRYWAYPNTYNWDIMPDSISSPYMSPTEGTLEMAKLMSDAGTSVNMIYGCDGSYAFTGNVVGALVNTFGYPSGISYVSYDPITVIGELQYGNRPVIMRGSDPAYGGHAWVCDGYERSKYSTIHNPNTYYEYKTYTYSPTYFSMNWGWDGSSNGWYLYSDFTPSIFNFNSSTMCVINIHP